MKGYMMLMLLFGALLLVFGWLVSLGWTDLILTFHRVKVKDKKAYARFLGQSIMLMSLTPILSGIVGYLTGPSIAAAVFLISAIALLVYISKKSEDHYR